MKAVGHLHLPLRVAGLAALVDEQAHDGGAVVARQGEDAVHSAARFLPVLEVGRVEDAASADAHEAGLHHLGFGGVEDEGGTGLGGEARGDLGHVVPTIPPDVVHAHVEDVGALADLFGGHAQARVPVAAQHRVAEGPRAVGVRTLADDEERIVLGESDRGIEGRDARFVDGSANGGDGVAHRLDHRAQVLGSGAAAPADDGDAQLGHVAQVVLGELGRSEVVVGASVDDARQSRIGQDADRNEGVLAEPAKVLLHLGGSGGAVDADDVGSHRGDGRVRGADLGAHEHATGRLHGDLNLDGNLPARRGHRGATGLHGGLHLQQVHARLDEEQIDPALEESLGLLDVGLAQFGESDVAEARELRTRSDAARHPAGTSIALLVLVRHAACDRGRRDVELSGALRDSVFGEHSGETAETRGLHGVDAGIEECPVHGLDDVGTGGAEHLVAALEGGPAEVVRSEIEVLHEGAESPVEDDDPFADGFGEGLACHGVTTLQSGKRE